MVDLSAKWMIRMQQKFPKKNIQQASNNELLYSSNMFFENVPNSRRKELPTRKKRVLLIASYSVT